MSISESFPSWFIGKEPSRQVIISAYGDSLAKRFGRKNRNKLKDWGERIFDIKLASNSANVSDWTIEGQLGSVRSASIGSGLTGHGADLLIIDDPIKNRAEAQSIVYRDRVWDEWQSTLKTRLHPAGRVIVIVTRWHEDDLIGRLLANDPPGTWCQINLPCEAEADDLLGRAEGEPLWPEHGFDADWIAGMKETTNAQTWAALFQQRPSPAEGNIIKREFFQNFWTTIPPKFDRVIQSWDLSFKKMDDSDFVVGQVWGKLGSKLYLVYQVRARLGFTETKRQINAIKEMFPQTGAILIEDKANGPAIIDSLKHDISGIIPINPRSSKVERMSSVMHFFEAGNVVLPATTVAPWVGAYIEELVSFPNAPHDDQVDATSQGLSYFISNTSFSMKNFRTGARLSMGD